jgi:site-specific DNA recombinase
MIAAIYARKSTDQNGVSDDAKSVTRQVENARAFAASKGWTVNESCVYEDDAISGAKFGTDRPGLARLLNALKPRQFEVLIVSEVSRVGREMSQTGHVFGEIYRAGVRCFSYLDGREILLESALDKVMLSLTTFAAELEREKARQRTRDAMLRKAKAGHVTGGRVFGYDNVRVNGHVERRINDAEAAVVRRIYELAALGQGLRVIAHSLNAEKQPSPRPQKGRPAGWAPSSVREVLGRPLYRGIIEWDKSRRNSEGKQSHARQNTDTVRVDAPHLRIIPDALAATVDAQRAENGERYIRCGSGRLNGRPAPRAVKHILSGLLRCKCGASFEGLKGGKDGGVYYVCSAARRKGPTVCGNLTRLPAALVEESILCEVETKLLTADVMQPALDAVLERLAANVSERASLEAERAKLSRELSNLAAAVAAGVDPKTFVAEIKKREARAVEIDQEMTRPSVDREGIRRALEAKIEDWRALLRGSPTHGRTVLGRLLNGGAQIYRSEEGIAWGALGAPKELLKGLYKPGVSLISEPHDRDTIEIDSTGLYRCVASPTGFEPVFWP